ncbi:MAG: glycosyltransferase family 4 protein [Clostridia bacterium]|nr:glycosyltransferase family 4 protein [Clostridia bacterium]MBQ4338227.1 glycosyltransferase family 4 protein [Clostridia bacterium]
MKIIIHSDEYYPTCAACAYRIKAFADVFTEKGNEVTVIASSANRGNGKIEDCCERILFSPAIKMNKKTTLIRMLNNLSFAFTSVFTAMKAGKADVVITTSPPPLVSISGWLIAKIKRANLVYDVRDIWPDVAVEMGSFTTDSFFFKIFKMITGFMYKRSDMITTVSPGKVEKIKQKLPDDMKGKVKLVSNGFDLKILESNTDEEIIKKYKLNESFTCVYIGNIGLAQGLGAVFDIAEQTKHRNVRFLLFGSGAEKDILENEASAKGLNNVSFCGVIPHDKVFTLLTNSQLSFIPLKSSKMKDSVPTKIYESLGVGCPVLLVAEGDSCDIVNESGMGCCVSPGKEEELIRTFDRIVDDYDCMISNRPKAMELIKNKYSRQQSAADFENKLRQLI